jgi:hypothetical protein
VGSAVCGEWCLWRVVSVETWCLWRVVSVRRGVCGE